MRPSGCEHDFTSLNEGDSRHGHGVRIEIRTGINTGEAVTTLDPPAGEALVTGVAVNAAARLEQLADPGQTVVAERTARLGAGILVSRDLGFAQLRGKEERGSDVRVARRRSPGSAARGIPGVHAPLVGRERELDLLLGPPGAGGSGKAARTS